MESTQQETAEQSRSDSWQQPQADGADSYNVGKVCFDYSIITKHVKYLFKLFLIVWVFETLKYNTVNKLRCTLKIESEVNNYSEGSKNSIHNANNPKLCVQVQYVQYKNSHKNRQS